MSKIEAAIKKALENERVAIQAAIEAEAAKEKAKVGTFPGAKDLGKQEIVQMDSDSFLINAVDLEKKKIIYQTTSQQDLIQRFRDIRTALFKRNAGNVVLVTSLVSGAGTSFFARNLAAVIAFESTRTALLVDCNIAKPSVAQVFDLQGAAGLIDYIENEESILDSHIYKCGIQRFRCLPAGNKHFHHSEYFTRPRFRALFDEIKKRYSDRNIIIDAPPILRSADAGILLDVCDQVIVVIPSGQITHRMVETVSSIVDKNKLAGVVFNEYIP